MVGVNYTFATIIFIRTAYETAIFYLYMSCYMTCATVANNFIMYISIYCLFAWHMKLQERESVCVGVGGQTDRQVDRQANTQRQRERRRGGGGG